MRALNDPAVQPDRNEHHRTASPEVETFDISFREKSKTQIIALLPKKSGENLSSLSTEDVSLKQSP